MSASDIVPISQGQLKAFMYENFGKGRQAEQERIIKLLEDGLSDYPDAFIQHLVSLIKISGDQE